MFKAVCVLPPASRRAPDRAYNCDICYNKTTRTRFWGFVSCIVKLDNLASGKDARLVELTDLVSLPQPPVYTPPPTSPHSLP